MTLSMMQVYSALIMICLLSLVVVIAIVEIQKRDEKYLKKCRELAQEKEKLRLLNLMHPEKRDEQGWMFVYEPEIKFISKYHENGKGKQSICAIRIWNGYDDDSDYYGYLIANLLNDNH